MELTDRIMRYLMETYRPDAVILYGSFADGSADENSDFDALVIAEHAKAHDSSRIGQTVLDVFLYPPEAFQGDFDPEEFVQVFDGKIVLDKTGAAARLQQSVLDYIAHLPRKTEEEIRQELEWCEKMLSRTIREDTEGYYRWHWVLLDSLEIYCDIRHQHYYGPKKALRLMEQTDADSFQLYSRALRALDRRRLAEWIGRLKRLHAAQ